jgi:hypothetical protein
MLLSWSETFLALKQTNPWFKNIQSVSIEIFFDMARSLNYY